MHLPYKSVTGRHTYVIYLMFFNIHAYLGFIQFINFSVWPAEMGKIKADVNVLPPFRCSATSCKAWNQRGNIAAAAATHSLPWRGPSLPPRGGSSFTGTRVSAAGLSQSSKISSKKDLMSDWKPGRHSKGNGPCSGDEKQDGAEPASPQQCLQEAMYIPLPSSQEFPRLVYLRNLTAF